MYSQAGSLPFFWGGSRLHNFVALKLVGSQELNPPWKCIVYGCWPWITWNKQQGLSFGNRNSAEFLSREVTAESFIFVYIFVNHNTSSTQCVPLYRPHFVISESSIFLITTIFFLHTCSSSFHWNIFIVVWEFVKKSLENNFSTKKWFCEYFELRAIYRFLQNLFIQLLLHK